MNFDFKDFPGGWPDGWIVLWLVGEKLEMQLNSARQSLAMLNQYWHLSLYDFDTYNLALRPIIPSCLYERYLHAVGDGADMFWAKLGCWSKDCHHPFLWSKRIMSCRWEKCSYQEGDKSLSQQQRSHQEEPAQSQHTAPPLSEYPYNNSNDFTINFLWSWVSAMEVLISSQVSIYFHALSRQ